MSDPADLVQAIRRLISASRVADLDELEFDEAIAMLDRLSARLEGVAVDDIRMQAALRFADVVARLDSSANRADRAREVGVAGFFPYSPYVGPLNPVAPPLDVSVIDGDPYLELGGIHIFDDVYNGPPGGVHGGVISGVFDELLGAVCVANDVAGFTGTLTVRYRSLTPLDRPITMRARVDRVEGRKTFALGTLHHDGVLCAEAEGIFVSATDDTAAQV